MSLVICFIVVFLGDNEMQALLGLYDHSITIGDETVQVTCCSTNWTMVAIEVTCGQGMSCIGQCTAKDASLCPSGVCGNCEQGLQFDEEEDSTRTRQGHAAVTLPPWTLSFCPLVCNRVPGWVRRWTICCYHPVCKKRKDVPQKCTGWAILIGKNVTMQCYDFAGR